MATQVSTSHTVQTRAPLRVPKRPAKNHVAIAIQTFLPYVVVFLLSLIAYSAVRPTTPTPSYSPPNVGQPDHVSHEFARDIIHKRTAWLEEIMRKAEMTNPETPKAAEWAAWSRHRANDLKERIEESTEKTIDNAKDVVSDMKDKAQGAAKDAMDSIKSVGDDIKDLTIEAAYWWKTYGDQLVDDVMEYGAEKVSETQDFAYDAAYAWKMKAGSLKEVTKSKLDDAKDAAKDTLEASKNKVEEVVEAASEGLQDIGRGAWEAGKDILGRANAAVAGRLEQQEAMTQAEYDFHRRAEGVPRLVPPHTAAFRTPSIVERVKDSFKEDEEARRDASMKEEWDQIDLDQKVSSIVQQICVLGSDVVEGVSRKLEKERC